MTTKFFSVLFSASCLFACYTEAALFREKPNPKRKANGCYTDQYGLGHLIVGDTKTVPGHCLRYSCESHGGIVYASCGTLGTHPGFEIGPADLTKPYPDCCPQLIRKEQ